MFRFFRYLVLCFLLTASAIAQSPFETEAESNSAKLLKMVQTRHFANLKEIERLIYSGADVNYADENGVTVLMHAAYHGVDAVKLMKLLIRHGADVNAQDNKGQTPIMFAASNYISRFQGLMSVGLQLFFIKRPDIADLRLLFDEGADLKIKDSEGRTVIDRVRMGVVQPSNILSSTLGYEIVAFQDGQKKVLKVLEGYAEIQRIEEEVLKIPRAELMQDKNEVYNETTDQKIERKLKEAQRQAWAERDKLVREQMDLFVFGETGLSHSNAEAIELFLEKLLKILSSESQEEFNFLMGLLSSNDIISFMERYGANLHYSSGLYPAYKKIMVAISDYRSFEIENRNKIVNNPALLELKNQKIKEINRSIQVYKGR